MKKVKYGITRYSKKGSYRFTGYGQLDRNDLITTYTDKTFIKKTMPDNIENIEMAIKKQSEMAVIKNNKRVFKNSCTPPRENSF
ncbi:MAG: hypothetical protein IJ538_02360 [Clostridia bacterium]|nr:hypothetical protein [Clostridia bacterium]